MRRLKRRLVPATVAELETSPEFTLDHTIGADIKCYVCPVTPRIAQRMRQEHPDYGFLVDEQKPYLLVFVYYGEMLGSDAIDRRLRTAEGQYTKEGEEVFAYAYRKTITSMTSEMTSELKRNVTGAGNWLRFCYSLILLAATMLKSWWSSRRRNRDRDAA